MKCLFYFMKLTIRLLLGLLFILSGVLKLIGMDAFELYVFKMFPIHWTFATLLARCIVTLELGIGVFYLLGLSLFCVNRLTLAVVFCFTIWLGFQWMTGNTENCHCFGELIQLSPAQSFFKNFILLFLILLLIRLKVKDKFVLPQRFTRLLFWIAILSVILVPVIASPPDFLMANRYSITGVSRDLVLSDFDSIPWKNAEESKITGNDAIVLFMSMKCVMCKKAAQKISILNIRFGDSLPIYYIFFGDSSYLQAFWMESESTVFPHKIIPSDIFFKYTKNLPTIFFIKQGKVSKSVGYRELDEGEVRAWIK